MSIVSLVSGGLDSTLMALMIKQEALVQWPLFINYGQLSGQREWAACRSQIRKLKLSAPKVIDISDWGRTISSGITDKKKRIFEDAFLPGRNMMFLLIAASYAYRKSVHTIAMGLLSDDSAVFPDQTRNFCDKAQDLLSAITGTDLKVITPLKGFSKADVVKAAKVAGIRGTYSCHAGTKAPCGKCVACREYIGIEV
jgi:7-cyano-7-deazaguanine synthase